jgi:hypothetical protein
MSNNNIDFAHAVIHNTDNATEQFKSNPEDLMTKYNLPDDSKEQLRVIGNQWTDGQSDLAEKGWIKWASDFIGPELFASMRW